MRSDDDAQGISFRPSNLFHFLETKQITLQGLEDPASIKLDRSNMPYAYLAKLLYVLLTELPIIVHGVHSPELTYKYFDYEAEDWNRAFCFQQIYSALYNDMYGTSKTKAKDKKPKTEFRSNKSLLPTVHFYHPSDLTSTIDVRKGDQAKATEVKDMTSIMSAAAHKINEGKINTVKMSATETREARLKRADDWLRNANQLPGMSGQVNKNALVLDLPYEDSDRIAAALRTFGARLEVTWTLEEPSYEPDTPWDEDAATDADAAQLHLTSTAMAFGEALGEDSVVPTVDDIDT